MPLGPGRYDDACTVARESTQAEAAVLIIFGGPKGTGFSVQAPADFVLHLPRILRNVADEIDQIGGKA